MGAVDTANTIARLKERTAIVNIVMRKRRRKENLELKYGKVCLVHFCFDKNIPRSTPSSRSVINCLLFLSHSKLQEQTTVYVYIYVCIVCFKLLHYEKTLQYYSECMLGLWEWTYVDDSCC